jgi:type II secretory pathway component PulF
VNMIRSGETSGQLSEVLEYLADQQEKDYDLRSKIRGAMIYPAFILGSMVIVGFVMMTFVVPKLLAVLREANVPLPLPTRLLVAVSGFFASFWWLILIFIVVFSIAFRVFMTTPLGKYLIDLCLLRLPIFGRLFQGMYVVRFTRSLATLTKGGVDTVGGLVIVAEVVGNEVWKRMIQETIREVNDGNSLTTVFERSPFVPSMMNQMLAVGEHTGRTQEILQRVSAFYSREIDNVVANLVALIEPVVLLLLGAGVGILVSAILLPLYSLSTGV